ncbi:MAG: flagellin [Acetobacter sp.]
MSVSINTNTSSMIAIETLNATQTALSQTENAVATGQKVSTSADNAASYGIAQQMTGNVSGQSAVNDGLTFASQIVSSTNTAANSILSVLKDVQNQVTSLGNNQSPTSLAQISAQITSDLSEIDTIARNATLNGVNLLSASTSDGLGISSSSLSFVTGLQGDQQTITGYATTTLGASYKTQLSSASVTVSGASSISTKNSLTDLLGLGSSASMGADATSNVFVTAAGSLNTSNFSVAGTTGLAGMVALVQQAIIAMTNVTSDLGAKANVITSMSAYGTTLSNNLTSGAGALTDADMTAESAKLTSLQTKQSLGIKALAIANSQSQNLLSLFQ